MIDKCVAQTGAYKIFLKKKNKNLGYSFILKKLETLQSLGEIGLSHYQYYLGVKYHKGDGVKKDHKEAAKWFQKAAEQGLCSAQLMLGFLHNMGMGVERDDQKALDWYHMAARKNNSTAMVN